MEKLTGGCQCGKVRFAVEPAAVGIASVCHCRMCQKAFGAFYAPLVSIERAGLAWTRGSRALFRSSNHVQRGFCAACGTPLSYEPDSEDPALAIGAFDDPERFPPSIQYGTERRLSYANRIPALPARATEESFSEAPFLSRIVSRQHPDHDTALWPPKEFPS